MPETQLQHHVEIGPDPHAAAEVIATLVRNDQKSGRDLPEGLPRSVEYREPHGPDRIPAPATVAREGTAACGALTRAEASKERATHVGVCRATGPDGKPVHHAFLIAAAKPGELPLVTGPDGKSLGPVDPRRVRDPSKDRGMNCGCHVPHELHQSASFAPIHPEHLSPEHPRGAAAPLQHADPAARAAAGEAYQGHPRAHRPATPEGRRVAEVAALAARAVTPPPGHEPRPAVELHPSPEVHHPEADHPHGHPKPSPEHLDRMTTEVAGALHTIAAGKNPHPLPEDPPVTAEHADAARKLYGTMVSIAKSTPAHELFDDPERQAQVLAIVPAADQVKHRERILAAAANLEHVDVSDPKSDVAVTVASELDAILPGTMPPEVGQALRRRRAAHRARGHLHHATELIDVGSEPDASLASGLALMVALDEWHVGCPWDGRRAPPPDHPTRPVAPPAADAPIGEVPGDLASQRRALDSAISAALDRARTRIAISGGDIANAFADPEVIAATQALAAFDKAHPDAALKGLDPAIGRGGSGGFQGGGHGFGSHGGGWGGYGVGGIDLLDCGDLLLDPMIGQMVEEEVLVEQPPTEEIVVEQFATDPRAVEWRTQYGERYWERPEWQAAHWRGTPAARRRPSGPAHLGPGPGLPHHDRPVGLIGEELFIGPIEVVMKQAQGHPRAAEWITAYGPRFWERPEWQRRFWHHDATAIVVGEPPIFAHHPRRAEWIAAYGPRFWERPEWVKLYGTQFPSVVQGGAVGPHSGGPRPGGPHPGGPHPGGGAPPPFRRGVVSGPAHPPGWIGPKADEHGAPLVIGVSKRANGTQVWAGPASGWVPIATWQAGSMRGGRFIPPGSVIRDHKISGAFADKDDSIECSLFATHAAALASDPRIAGWHGWNYRGLDRVISDRHAAAALRRYWGDAEFRKLVDSGHVVDGWDLGALYEVVDPPVYGWWGRLWGREADHHAWWRRDRSWDRGWDWWAARLPAHHHREWLRRYYAEPDFRRRADSGERVEGSELREVLGWARGVVPGSVPDVIVGLVPIAHAGGFGGGLSRPTYTRPTYPAVAPVVQGPAVDQYGNVLDAYGNPVVGPGGGPVVGPTAPVVQVPLHGVPHGFSHGIHDVIPQELWDTPAQEVADGIQQARRTMKGRPCPTGRCPRS